MRSKRTVTCEGGREVRKSDSRACQDVSRVGLTREDSESGAMAAARRGGRHARAWSPLMSPVDSR